MTTTKYNFTLISVEALLRSAKKFGHNIILLVRLIHNHTTKTL